MGAQEDGTVPMEGVSALYTFSFFFALPIAIFTVITLLVLAGTAKRKNSDKSVITHIE